MFNELYIVLFVLSFIMMIMLVYLFKFRISVYYILMFATIVVSNCGYMQIANVNAVREGIMANQIVYLGACYTPFFLLMCVSDLCKFNIKPVYRVAFIVFGSFIFFLVSTIEIFPLYYKGAYLVKENGVTYLLKEYGPLHFLYPLHLLIVIIIGFAIIIDALRRKRDVSYVTSISLLAVMVITVAIYIIEKSLHLVTEILPLAYVIGQFAMLVLLKRTSLYDVVSISMESMSENNEYGFVICDSAGNYLGCDETSKKWFPELNELSIDRKFSFVKTELLEQMSKWIEADEKSDTAYFKCDKYIIEAKHSIFKERKVKTIHCVYLRDDTQQQEYNNLMKQYNEDLEHDVNEKTDKINRIQDDIIISMASIVENRDNSTGGHIARTSDVIKIFVEHLLKENCCKELTPAMASCIVKAAPLHDFGKISIPDIVLNKPGKFTDEEYNIMKGHSANGAVIVARILQNSEDIQFKQIAVNVAHYHHEKWDGNGYPEGKKGEDIPFEARVMALADVFDALVSKRVYKESFGYDKAFGIIEESCGSHFDPLLCKEFIKCRKQLEELYDSYGD